MKFARPELLFLLWAVPVLLLIMLHGGRRRKAILARFARGKSLGAINPEVNPVRRRVKAVVMLIAVAALAAALSGVLYGYTWETTHRKGVSLVAALDCSRSMLAGDIKPSRLERAKREIIDLLGMLKGDRVGLVAFAGAAFLQCPMTLDYSAFQMFLNALGPDYLPVGGTDLAGAIRTSIKAFDEKDPTEKAVILITDGESTTSDALAAAREAADLKIKIFCIGVGGPDGAPIPDGQGGFKKENGKIILSKLDEETLKKIALTTDGAYVRSVSGDMDLEAIYKDEIRGGMEARDLEDSRRQEFKDRYQWLVGLAVAALFVDLFLSSAKAATLGLVFCLFFGLAGPAWAGARADVQKGLEAYEQQDYQTALDSFLKAQVDDPDNPAVLYNLGAAYYKLGRFKEAEQSFQQASEDEQLKAKSLYNLGNSSFKQGRLQEAINYYEGALKVDETDKDAEKNIDYVKKLLQQQQQQQNNQDQDKKESSKDQQKSDNGSSGDKQDEKQKDQEQQSDQNGSKNHDQEQGSSSDAQQKKNDSGRQDEKYADSIQRDQLPGDEKQQEQAQASPAAGQEQPKDEGQNPAVDASMLNRLPDRIGPPPGARYKERKVEKDW